MGSVEYSDKHFNPRPPWGGRHFTMMDNLGVAIFQSTPSVGRATILCSVEMRFKSDFNPRPPWGGRPEQSAEIQKANQKFQSTPSVGRATDDHDVQLEHVTISIHALRGEGDANAPPKRSWGCLFQSTPSVGRATTAVNMMYSDYYISIHALRGEGDIA